MNIERLKLVYFSPTGTTRAVAQAIARGIAPRVLDVIDITKPDARTHPLPTHEDDLLVVAVPVYMGRVPDLLGEWLNAIQADGTPTVCVVVYGNRVYDNALLELNDIVRGRGCVPVASAAYVGEHSFSNAETPVAPGRPDKDDLAHAEAFGRQIRAKLLALPPSSKIQGVAVPGAHPYGGVTTLWNVDFIEVNALCPQCGVCAEVCPVGAIDPQDSARIDQVKCITCCACIKNCPQDARTMKPGPVKDAAIRLNRFCKEQKKPEYFL
ncbi:MAG: 4Fe-4S binding protein [Rhodospirillales bacterium]|nr:4Fe-4S binding protein [Rhodospirillales bacterium]